MPGDPTEGTSCLDPHCTSTIYELTRPRRSIGASFFFFIPPSFYFYITKKKAVFVPFAGPLPGTQSPTTATITRCQAHNAHTTSGWSTQASPRRAVLRAGRDESRCVPFVGEREREREMEKELGTLINLSARQRRILTSAPCVCWLCPLI